MFPPPPPPFGQTHINSSHFFGGWGSWSATPPPSSLETPVPFNPFGAVWAGRNDTNQVQLCSPFFFPPSCHQFTVTKKEGGGAG
jgi:hypothetical protein